MQHIVKNVENRQQNKVSTDTFIVFADVTDRCVPEYDPKLDTATLDALRAQEREGFVVAEWVVRSVYS